MVVEGVSGVAFGFLGVLWAALGSLGRHLVALGHPRVSLGAPTSIFHEFGLSFGKLGASPFDKYRALDRDFSIHAFGMVSGRVFRWFADVQGDPGT